MVEVASVFQGCQIGVQSVVGTPVPADKKLLALSIEPAINPETRKFKPMGSKATSIVTLDREWTAVNLTASPTYSELIYPLSSILTGVEADAGSGASQWLFNMLPSDPDDVKVFTVEYGNATTGARSFSDAVVRSFGLSFSRTGGVTGRGEMIGVAITEDITLTADPTKIPLVPILPSQTCIYLDTDIGDIGTTKLHRVWTANWNLNNKFSPVWPLDCDLPSYAAVAEREADHTLELTMAYDAEGREQLARLRDSSTAFIRIEATGALIGGGNNYRLRLDFAGKISAAARPSNVDDVYSIGWTFEAVEDPDWGKVVEIELINEQDSL